MLVVFTDLDNCLLDHHTYQFEAAARALGMLRARKVPVVFVTSKTRAEVEHWQALVEVSHPSVVENGGAVVLADGRAVELGKWRSEVIAGLADAASEAEARWRGFSQMSHAELVERTSLPPEIAALAAQRQYSEPFVLETPEREAELRQALERRGLRLTRGGRFHHALAHAGKHEGVAWLLHQLRQEHEQIVSIGLGDAPNAEGFLRLVDHPVVLGGPHAEAMLDRIPHARAAAGAGPGAWNGAVLELLKQFDSELKH